MMTPTSPTYIARRSCGGCHSPIPVSVTCIAGRWIERSVDERGALAHACPTCGDPLYPSTLAGSPTSALDAPDLGSMIWHLCESGALEIDWHPPAMARALLRIDEQIDPHTILAWDTDLVAAVRALYQRVAGAPAPSLDDAPTARDS